MDEELPSQIIANTSTNIFKQSFENKVSFNFTDGETRKSDPLVQKEIVINMSDQHPKDSPIKTSSIKQTS